MKRLIALFCFFFFLNGLLFASDIELHRNYLVTHPYVTLSDITGEKAANNKPILHFEAGKHILRIKGQKLQKILQKHGCNVKPNHFAYIQFTQKSPIDTTKIKNAIKALYKKHYKAITIKAITITPRAYTTELPQSYSVGFSKKAYLKRDAICFIKTPQNKKLFFSYEVDATLPVIFTRQLIQKGEPLTKLNTEKKSIMLQNFRAMPLQELPPGKYEAKHRLKANRALTQRDVKALYLIKRGSEVTVTLKNDGIVITFSAKAVQNGHLGDKIKVQKSNNKRLYVRVTGKNKAEVE